MLKDEQNPDINENISSIIISVFNELNLQKNAILIVELCSGKFVPKLIDAIKESKNPFTEKACAIVLNEIISFVLRNEEARKKENRENDEPDEPQMRLDYFEQEITVIDVDFSELAKVLAEKTSEIMTFLQKEQEDDTTFKNQTGNE